MIHAASVSRRIPLAAVLALVLAAALPPASAAAAPTATISAGLSVASTTPGQTVYVEGAVTPAGATPRVVVQREVDGRWSDRDAGLVDPATGRYRIAIRPSQHGSYVLRVRSNAASVVSPEVVLRVDRRATKISVAISASRVVRGASVRLRGTVIEPDATPRVVAQRLIGSTWVDRDAALVDQRSGAYLITIAPTQTGTYTMRVRSGGGTRFSPAVTLVVVPPVRQVITYVVETRGRPGTDVEAFARHAAATFADRRGWSMGGSIEYRRVARGGHFTLVLAAPAEVPRFGAPCDSSYSCRSGRYVIINDLRYRTGAPGWGRSLDEYRHYVVNHELGHWLGLGHASCPGSGAAAPVMQQQSIRTSPCVNTVWPLSWERQRVASGRGVPIYG